MKVWTQKNKLLIKGKSESELHLGPVSSVLKFYSKIFQGFPVPAEHGPSHKEVFSSGSEADGFGL